MAFVALGVALDPRRPGRLVEASGEPHGRTDDRGRVFGLPVASQRVGRFAAVHRLRHHRPPVPGRRRAPLPRVPERTARLARSSECVVAAAYADVLLVAGLGAQLFRGPDDPFLAGRAPQPAARPRRSPAWQTPSSSWADVALAALFVVAVVLLARRWRTRERACSPRARSRALERSARALPRRRPADPLSEHDTSEGRSCCGHSLRRRRRSCRSRSSSVCCARGCTAPVVADLVVELGSLPPTGEVRDAIARTLGDPSLELAFWLPEDERYVDPDGNALDPAERARTRGHRARARREAPRRARPRPGAARRPRARRGGRRRGEPRARELAPAGGAARPARRGARLARPHRRGRRRRAAAARARPPRRRAAAPARDPARAPARPRPGSATSDARSSELLAEADAEVVGALEELRALARGIHPAILTEEGLAPALAALARRAPVPVELTVCARSACPRRSRRRPTSSPARRSPTSPSTPTPPASTIDVTRANGRLAIEITDDGVGGADADGAGLRGLRDRVEALDGRLSVESPRGGGTRVTAAIPCA